MTMRKTLAAGVALAALVAMATAAYAAAPPQGKLLVWEKVRLAETTYESAAVFDVNNDGKPDIFCGDSWFAGPDFKVKGNAGPIKATGDYFDDFGEVPIDVNGDGYLDVVTGGWFGKSVRWRENPKGDPAKEWPEHLIAECGSVEALDACDLDGDGRLEIVPNTPNQPQKVYKLVVDAAGKGTGKFAEIVISEKPLGHGLGCGDINGDGRPDIVYAKGWIEAPKEPLGGAKWAAHEEFSLGSASVPVIVADVNGDKLADLIVGQSHEYGLDWWEQKRDGDKRTWTKHPIDPFNSQYHALVWTDVDGDGKPDLVTGKRLHAHRDKDPGDADPAGTYYFKWTGEGFAKQVIDYGVGAAGKGCGIFFPVTDVNGDGRPDVIAPGKDGLNLYVNKGFAEIKKH